MPVAFIDTNVLVYAADETLPVPRKTAAARKLLSRRGLRVSVQVLNEFTVNARSPSKLNFTRLQERQWIGRWLMFEVVPLTVDTYLSARRIHERHQISHWDALVLAAAEEAGCEVVFSEDFSHGRKYGSVTAIDPFR